MTLLFIDDVPDLDISNCSVWSEVETIMLTCSSCNQALPDDCFHYCKRNTGRRCRRSICNVCRREYKTFTENGRRSRLKSVRARRALEHGLVHRNDMQPVTHPETGKFWCDYTEQWVDIVEPDHVIPLVKGGTNHPANLLWLERGLNRSKRDKDALTWAAGQGITLPAKVLASYNSVHSRRWTDLEQRAHDEANGIHWSDEPEKDLKGNKKIWEENYENRG